MTIKLTAYDTFIGSSHKQAKQRFIDQVIDLDINTGFLQNNAETFMKLTDTFREEGMTIPTVISPVLAAENNVVPCEFPTLITVPSIGSAPETTFLVADARAYIRGKSLAEAQISNSRDFEFLRVRTMLTALWVTKGTQPLKAVSRLLPAMYAFWMGDKLAQQYVLDPGERLKVRIIAYLYHLCQYTNAEIVEDADRRMQAAVAARVLVTDPKITADLFARLPQISSADMFIEVLKEELQNPRINDLNLGVLATRMAGTWYQEGKMNAVVAIEHPPTFAAMVYSAFSQRGYRDTPTFKALERFKATKGEQEITRAIALICNP